MPVTHKGNEVLLPILTNLGTDYRCYKIAQSLKKMGWEPVVLCDRPKTPPGPMWDSLRVEVLTRSSHLDGFIRTFCAFQWKLLFYLFKTKSLLWIAEDCPPLLTAALVGKIRSRTVVYDSHEIFTETAAVKRSILRKLFWGLWHNLGFSLAAKIITVSPDYIDFFKKKFPSKRYYLLPNVPLRSSSVRPAGPLGVKIKLVFQGYLRPDTNLRFLLNALADQPQFELKIIGQGSEEPSLQEIVRELKLEDRIEFLPTVPFEQLPELIARSDIGIHLIQPESISADRTWANKIFDYLHAGIPSILGNTTGIATLLRECPLGVKVEGGDSSSIAGGLKLLVQNYEHYEEACRAHREKYLWENYEEGLQYFLDGNAA